jgi:dihydrofolate reductase
MGKLTITSFLTLDGIVQGPGGPDEDRSGGFDRGGWLAPYVEDEFMAWIASVFQRPGAFLLGRVTYEIFASYWPKQTDPKDPVAAQLNGLPKYVASRTLQKAEWTGTRIVRDVKRELPAIKERTLGELQVHGSAGLAQTLLAEGLADELNLVFCPVTLGGPAKRFFGAGTVPSAFALASSRTTPTGLVLGTWVRKGAPAYGTVGE